MEYKFNKPYYTKDEHLEMFSLSHGTLARYKEEWLKQGKELSEMGYLPIKGIKGACWDPVKFLSWLLANKVDQPVKYSHEQLEQNKLQQSVIKLKKRIFFFIFNIHPKIMN